MFFNRFFNICILISSVFFSKCTDGKKLTIKKKQFVFHTFYENDSNTPPISFENEELTIDEGLSFQDIIGKLKFKSSYGDVSPNKIVGEKKFQNINEKIIDDISKSGFFLEKIDEKKYNPVSLTDVFTSEHVNSNFILAYFFSDILLNFDGKEIYISDKGKVKFIEFLLKYFEGFNNLEEFRKTFLDLITKELGEEGLTCVPIYKGYKEKYTKEFLEVFNDNFPANKYNVSLEIRMHKYGNDVKDLDFYKCLLDGFILSLQDYGDSLRTLKLKLSSKNIIRKILPYDERYIIKPDINTSVACGDFFYIPSIYILSRNQLERLLEGNGCNDYKDLNIYEEERGGKIFIKDEYILVPREKVKLDFKIKDTNTLEFKDKDFFNINEVIYKDELENKLKQYGPIESFQYDEKSVKKNETLVINIINPIEGKVDYVQKKVKIYLMHDLDDIYELECDKKQFEYKFNINTSLKQVLDAFFKHLNDEILINSDTRPKNYEVLGKNGSKIEDYEKYLITEDQNINIKLDVIDSNYFEKIADCDTEWIVELEDYNCNENGTKIVCVPKITVYKTKFYKDLSSKRSLFIKMLEEELKNVFSTKGEIKIKTFYTDFKKGNVVKLCMSKLPDDCIKEKYFEAEIRFEAPNFFELKSGINGFNLRDFKVKIESTVGDVLKQIATEIKEKYSKNKIPVFDSICYGNKGSSYIKFKDGDIIQPCSCIKVMFKPYEKLNEEYIKETFDVNIDNVIIELKQLYPWYVLKEKITNEKINIDLHKGDTYGEFKKKVAVKLKEIVGAKDNPILFFQNKNINDSEKLTKTNREDLAIYLDLGSSEEYFEKNTKFKEDDCNFFFYFKSDLKGFKIKEKYKDECKKIRIKELEGIRLTLGELKKVIEKEFKINKDQYKISYENGGADLNNDSIEISGCYFYIDLVDSNLTEYLSPLIQLKCKIEYEKPNYGEYKDYIIDDSAPKEHTVEITEDSFDKININDFVYHNIIDFFLNKKVFDKNIYAESLNGNKISYEEDNKLLKDCINKEVDVINIKLKVYPDCKLLVSKNSVKHEDDAKKKYKKDINIKKESKNEIDTKKGGKKGDKASSSTTKNVGEKEIDKKEKDKTGDKASSSTTKKEYPIGGSGNKQQGGAGNTQESGGCCRSFKTKKEKSDNKEKKKRRCCCGR